VSLFEVSPEIDDGDEVKVGNWVKHKKTFYFVSPMHLIYCIFSTFPFSYFTYMTT
jgi:hypothetical protein